MPRTGPFDEHADRYEAWFERNRDAYLAELEAVRRLMPLPPAAGLEVGVGSGRFAAPLGIGFGVEPSREMALRARGRGVRVCLGVAETLPFRDSRFDFVLMVTTICFVDDVRRSFGEAQRVLKPGGRLIVGFVDRESGLGKRYFERREASAFYREATFFSFGEVAAHLSASGFRGIAAAQTLIPGEETAVRDGYGEGAFAAVRATK